MPASAWPSFRFLSALFACGLVAVVLAVATVSPVFAQEDRIRPVTDAELQDPSPDEWLMWRRTLNGWGYSPLDQVNRDNVAGLQMVWSRALRTLTGITLSRPRRAKQRKRGCAFVKLANLYRSLPLRRAASRGRRWSATACCSCRTRATSSRPSTR